ncbi:MAG: NADPH dehydrogenase [Peptoniphilaceae bacterium]|uniref:oxidoreductase n=1 Tax=Parvimonas sp. TaxID=1944660 RepID=UPI0025D979C7|nr:NADPH dehydrogenase [Parvimonas sp.]MCI5997809.1 NADPH dehydrogenase [Parvimonas sp.]MDD7765347.1 NADPH dehydrogenase [Peptoniphilaceae bacterium]MDY3050185.1 NADPH dehydrogenase [Parvimonas sp.]
MSKLLSPIKIGKNIFKNRVVMAPMCMFHKKTVGGVLTVEHFDHYVARALGGVSGIIVEATMINETGGIRKVDLGLYNEKQRDEFKKLVDRVHNYDCKIGIQLSHAGRKADSTYEELVAPSDIAFGDYRVPKKLTVEEIKKLVEQFTKSAVLAKEAGFDFIEIHGAHGYLISQFLSPLSNKRQDEYGGNLENRYRFLKEILTSVKENVDIDIHIRISANEYDKSGNDIYDIIQILKWAKDDGVVFNSISSGGIVPSNIETYSAYQAELSREISKEGLLCSAVGLLDDYGLCEYLLQSNACSMIYQGRALLKNPNWTLNAVKYFDEKENFEIPIDSYGVIL